MHGASKPLVLRPRPTPIEALPWVFPLGVQFFVKREDRIHETVSGNKFWKLYYNLEEAQLRGAAPLISFGGAFSNHLYALAAAGQSLSIPTLGVVRGEEGAFDWGKTLAENATLRASHRFGMRFRFVPRSVYRDKAAIAQALKREFPGAYLLPEGGTNALAVKGCRHILTEETQRFDFILAAVGTGGTLSGLIQQAAAHQQVIGVPVLENAHFLQADIARWVGAKDNWKLFFGYHRGGYARVDSELVNFVNGLKAEHRLPLDAVYTAKAFWAACDLAQKAYFRPHSKVLLLHTGGLQGNSGMRWRLRDKAYNLI